MLKKAGHGHEQVRAAYSLYNATTDNKLTDLIRFALVKAKELGYDVFNALDIMENQEVFHELKFGVGDGFLHYYLWNWNLPTRVSVDKLGVVLV